MSESITLAEDEEISSAPSPVIEVTSLEPRKETLLAPVMAVKLPEPVPAPPPPPPLKIEDIPTSVLLVELKRRVRLRIEADAPSQMNRGLAILVIFLSFLLIFGQPSSTKTATPPPPPSVGIVSPIEGARSMLPLFKYAPGNPILDTLPVINERYDDTTPLSSLKGAEVALFLRGYARMERVCSEMARQLGLQALAVTTAEHTGRSRLPQTSPESPRLSPFDDPFYLASASLFSPHFCINLPLMSKPTTDEERDILDTWTKLLGQGTVATTTLRGNEVFTKSPLHQSAALLVFERYFFARDLVALGRGQTLSQDPSAYAMRRVPYTQFLNASLLAGSDKGDVCLCGAHLGLARHMVLYASPSMPHGRLHVEPVIIRSTDPSKIVQASDLPWTSVDAQLRQALQLTSFVASSTIYVDVMVLDMQKQRGYVGMTLSSHRHVMHVQQTAEAICLQYCEALHYALRHHYAHSQTSEALGFLPSKA